MNKTVFAALSFAVAMSVNVGLADQYADWFKGIGASPTSLSSLGAEGGSWSGLSGEGISFANSRIVLEDVETAINFTISATEPDTEVLDRVEVTMSGLAGAITSLPTSAEMIAGGAQLSVALASNNGSLGYYAWFGDTDGDTDGVADWVKLTGATPVEDTDFTLVVDVDYSVAKEPRVRFALKGNPEDVLLEGPNGEWTPITADAAQSVRRLSGVKFGGNGKLAKVDGSVRLGFAKVGDVKYPTIAAAVAAAKTGTDKKVQVIRKTSENVDMTGAGDVVLADGGNMSGTVTVPPDQPIKIAPAVGEFTTPGSTITGASGEYTLATKISGGTITAADITLPPEIAPYKEIVGEVKRSSSDNSVKVTLQTKDTIVGAVSVGGRTLKVTDELKTFLANKVGAYTAPDSSTANLQAALEKPGTNKLPVWESYVLGLDPEDATSVPKCQPVGADDTLTNKLKVKVPAVKPPSDSGYDVKFRVMDGVTKVGDFTDPLDIQLPLDGSAHAYTITPVIISK